MSTFTVNIMRHDPYKTYRFLVYFGSSTAPVAAVSKVTTLKRVTDVIEYKEGGFNIIHKGVGRTKYDPITLERGVTQDLDFIGWANSTQKLDQGMPTTSLANLRREIARSSCSTKWASRCTATSCIAAGCRNFRPWGTSTPARRRSRSNTSSWKTRDGRSTRA